MFWEWRQCFTYVLLGPGMHDSEAAVLKMKDDAEPVPVR